MNASSLCNPRATATVTYNSSGSGVPVVTVPHGGGAGVHVPWYTFFTSSGDVFETQADAGGSTNQQGNTRLVCKKAGLYLFAQAVAWPNANYTRSSRIVPSILQLGLAATATADTGAYTGIISAFVAPPLTNSSSWIEFHPLTGYVVVQAINFDPVTDRAISTGQLLAIYLGPSRLSVQVYP